MKAVAILGSPRADGSTATLVGEMLRALREGGVQTQAYHLGSLDIAYCRGCKACEAMGRCAQTDDVARVMRAVLDADMVLAASPSYWGDVTGQMKVFIDRCTPYGNTNPARPQVAPRAKGVAVAIRAGESKAESMQLVRTIEHYLGHLDIPLVAHFTAEGIGTPDDLRPALLADAYAFGEGLAGLLKG